MGWAKFAIEALQRGETVTIRPRGHSMKDRVNDGDRVTLVPAKPEQLEVGDVVLVRVKGNVYLHLIKATSKGRFLIGNNRGKINGWVGPNCVYGVAIQIEPS
jgi:SOS-response transcriptional repressor LexA